MLKKFLQCSKRLATECLSMGIKSLRIEYVHDDKNYDCTIEDWKQIYDKCLCAGFIFDEKHHELCGDAFRLMTSLYCHYPKCNNRNITIDVLKSCKECHTTRYCSKRCQKKDWVKRHKQLCYRYKHYE